MSTKSSRVKIAVFLCGPIRFADKTIDNINKLLADYEHELFGFFWKEDLGIKERNSSFAGDLGKMYNFKCYVEYESNSREAYESKFGSEMGCHSSINSILGMFYSISHLALTLKIHPMADEYTHILRARTDLCFFEPHKFGNKFDLTKGIINVVKNHSIPSGWVSDHFMLCDAKSFNDIWCYETIDKFIMEFNKAGRNPEKLLGKKCKKYKKNFIATRFESYHVLYNPPKSDDPKFIKELNKESNFIANVYNFKHNKESMREAMAMNKHWDQISNESLTRKVVRKLRRFFNENSL